MSEYPFFAFIFSENMPEMVPLKTKEICFLCLFSLMIVDNDHVSFCYIYFYKLPKLTMPVSINNFL